MLSNIRGATNSATSYMKDRLNVLGGLFQYNLDNIEIKDTDENAKIRAKIQEQLVSDFRNSMNKMLDKWEKAEV